MAVPSSIADYLDRNGVSYSVMPHRVAYTAQEEAAAAHVPGREWAKPVVCMADDQPILAVLPADFLVDLERLRRALNAGSVRLATEAEFSRWYDDCEAGAMPPFGPLYGQRVLVDTSLTLDRDISFNAGSHREAIRMSYGDFERLVKPTVAEFGIGPIGADQPAALTDPVCGTAMDEHHLVARSEHQGQTYYFCSQRCKMEFDDNPYVYSRKP
jgi:Ala-tRNA(Pro) deacylase